MIKTKTFNNNVRLVYENIPSVRTVSIGIWINNGSIHEQVNENGISHFIEHMLFKGTYKRTQKEIAEAIDNIGGVQNAFTSKEFTCYYIRALDTHLELSLDVLCDMFFNSKFDENDIGKERNVINEEIKMYEDLPDDLVIEQFNSNVYKGHSYSLPILGTKDSLATFNHKTFKNYLNKRYCCENVVVSIAGNFDENKTLDLVEKYIGTEKFGSYDNLKIEKPIYKQQIIKTPKNIEQAHLLIGYEGLNYYNDNVIDLSIFSSIFGGSSSSILNQIVREKYGYAYTIYSSSSSSSTHGLFSVYAGLSKENINHVIEIVDKEFKEHTKNIITEERLNNAKEQFKSQLLMSLENTSNCMTRNGKNLIAKDKVLTVDETLEKINNVTLNSLHDTVNKIYVSEPSISLVGDIDDIII